VTDSEMLTARGFRTRTARPTVRGSGTPRGTGFLTARGSRIQTARRWPRDFQTGSATPRRRGTDSDWLRQRPKERLTVREIRWVTARPTATGFRWAMSKDWRRQTDSVWTTGSGMPIPRDWATPRPRATGFDSERAKTKEIPRATMTAKGFQMHFRSARLTLTATNSPIPRPRPTARQRGLDSLIRRGSERTKETRWYSAKPTPMRRGTPTGSAKATDSATVRGWLSAMPRQTRWQSGSDTSSRYGRGLRYWSRRHARIEAG